MVRHGAAWFGVGVGVGVSGVVRDILFRLRATRPQPV